MIMVTLKANEYMYFRRSKMKEIRLMKKLGVKFTIYKKDGVGRFRVKLDKDQCDTFYINDLNLINDEMWDLIQNSRHDYDNFMSFKKIKPLLLKDETGYKHDVRNIKDILVHPSVRIDHGLIEFTKLEVLYDACTEDVNEYLERGWRIISCIPQIAQRRPDYILGIKNADS